MEWEIRLISETKERREVLQVRFMFAVYLLLRLRVAHCYQFVRSRSKLLEDSDSIDPPNPFHHAEILSPSPWAGNARMST